MNKSNTLLLELPCILLFVSYNVLLTTLLNRMSLLIIYINYGIRTLRHLKVPGIRHDVRMCSINHTIIATSNLTNIRVIFLDWLTLLKLILDKLITTTVYRKKKLKHLPKNKASINSFPFMADIRKRSLYLYTYSEEIITTFTLYQTWLFLNNSKQVTGCTLK